MRRPLPPAALLVSALALTAGCGPEKKIETSTPPSNAYQQPQRPRPADTTPPASEPGTQKK
jgi:hypothetical protein